MCKGIVLVVALLAALPLRAETVTIPSAEFSFAFGATTTNPNTWTDTENAATNSDTTQGDFSFAPAPYGPRFGNAGPTFANQTLGDGTGLSVSGWVGSTTPYSFTVPITASYNGAAPMDVDPSNPGYKLTLDITNISIWVDAFDSSCTTAAWDETTPQHTQSSSPPLSLPVHPGFDAAGSYQHLAWDPNDYSVSLAGLNSTFTRTFAIASIGANEMRCLDGIQVSGLVHLTYNAVPEPGTLALLLTVGLVGMLAHAWRKRK